MKKKNVVAIIGIETIRDSNGVVKKFSETFLNNIRTWKRDNPKDNLVIIDALKYLKVEKPLDAIWKAVCDSYDEIDQLIYFGHSSDESLIVFSYTLEHLSLEERWFRAGFHYDAPFAPDAEIFLYGCQTGGQRGEKWDTSLAQIIANKTNRTVWAYVSKSYQIEKPKGHFYQISDDKIGLVKFTHNERVVIDELPKTVPVDK